MILKVYYENVELELPLVREENDVIEMTNLLQNDFKSLVDNIKVLEYFGITFRDGE